MDLYFKDLDSFIADVTDYEKVLNVTITDENGVSRVQLIGIDGKPTNDDSVLGSRQMIFSHFRELYKAYLHNSYNPNIEEFNDAHTIALITSSSAYRRYVEIFDAVMNEVDAKYKELDKIKKDLLSNRIPDSDIEVFETKALAIVDHMYSLAYKMKVAYEGAVGESISARLMNMIIGYISVGRDFFDDESFFEDTFTPCTDDMFKAFNSLRRTLKFNARCNSAKDMITFMQ